MSGVTIPPFALRHARRPPLGHTGNSERMSNLLAEHLTETEAEREFIGAPKGVRGPRMLGENEEAGVKDPGDSGISPGRQRGRERYPRQSSLELAEEFSRFFSPIGESVVSIPAPRRDHRKHQDPAFAEQFSMSARV